MPKTNYPFLQKWKAKEKNSKRPVNRTQIMVMGGAPLAGAQPPANMQFTGYGEDGQLQPENPVEMINTQQGQKLVHEGEVKVTYPDGQTVVVPANELPQKKLQELQRKGMQGFQAGGAFRQAQPSPTPTPGPQAKKPRPPIFGGKPRIPKVTGEVIPQPSPQPFGQQAISPAQPFGQQAIPPAQPFGQQVGGMGQFSEEVVAPPPTPKPAPQYKGIGGQITPQVGPQIEEEEPPLTEDELKYQQTLQKLTKLSEGESELDRRIREEERARFKGEEQAGRGALEQQLSQLGLTGREALTERAMAGRGFAAMEAEVISNLRKGQADRAFQASMALPGATLAGMKLKMDKDQWQKMFDLGKEKWDYGKKLDLVNSLIQQGGAENYQQASELLEGLFGQGVDFSNALNAENQSNFFSGMDLISSSLASGLSWEDTMKALEQGGLLDKMGMSESDIKGMYDNMKLQSDPLYQAMQMTDQWVEQGLMTQEEADDFMAMIKHGLTNQDDYDISDGFAVYDENNNEVGFFKTQAEADEFMKDHPDWKSEFMENHIQPKEKPPPEEEEEEEEEITDKEWDDMSINEQWEHFQETMPPEVLNEWGTDAFNKWKRDGKQKTYDDWEKEFLTPTKPVQEYQEKIGEEGWGAYDPKAMEKKTGPGVEEMFLRGRERFLEGEVDQYSFEQMKTWTDQEWAANLFHSPGGGDTGALIMLEDHPNPVLVVSAYHFPGGGRFKVVDLYTGEVLELEGKDGKISMNKI